MRGSGQRLPITLRFTRVLGTFSHTTCFPFSCALRACFSDRSVSGERSEPIGALMPHAALRVVQQDREVCMPAVQQSFNAARGFAGGAARPHGLWLHHPCIVSMPHAALWVVQQGYPYWKVAALAKFQCRTRLCGWCSLTRTTAPAWALVVSMPHAALWVVQRNGRLRYRQILEVSMPHAALWVVQPL